MVCITGRRLCGVGGALLIPLLCHCEDPSQLFRLPVEANVDQHPLDFGEVVIGTSSVRTIYVENSGDGLLTVEMSLSGAADFSSLTRATLVVAPRSLAELPVQLQPRQLGTLVAEARLFTDDDEQRSFTVTLHGVGTSVPDCDDGDPCTAEHFDLAQGLCVSWSREGQRCDDGNACTEQGVCVDGLCLGRALSCDDGIECTYDYCDPAHGCVNAPEHGACDDGDPCTDDLCAADGSCQHRAASDGTACGEVGCDTIGFCMSGACQRWPTPDGATCDDGDPCTHDDACLAGTCVGAPAAGPLRFTEQAPFFLEGAWVARDELLYQINGHGLAVYDLSDLARPQLLALLEVPGETLPTSLTWPVIGPGGSGRSIGRTLLLAGPDLLLVGGFTSGLRAYSLADPRAPRELVECDEPELSQGLRWPLHARGDEVFFATASHGSVIEVAERDAAGCLRRLHDHPLDGSELLHAAAGDHFLAYMVHDSEAETEITHEVLDLDQPGQPARALEGDPYCPMVSISVPWLFCWGILPDLRVYRLDTPGPGPHPLHGVVAGASAGPITTSAGHLVALTAERRLGRLLIDADGVTLEPTAVPASQTPKLVAGDVYRTGAGSLYRAHADGHQERLSVAALFGTQRIVRTGGALWAMPALGAYSLTGSEGVPVPGAGSFAYPIPNESGWMLPILIGLPHGDDLHYASSRKQWWHNPLEAQVQRLRVHPATGEPLSETLWLEGHNSSFVVSGQRLVRYSEFNFLGYTQLEVIDLSSERAAQLPLAAVIELDDDMNFGCGYAYCDLPQLSEDGALLALPRRAVDEARLDVELHDLSQATQPRALGAVGLEIPSWLRLDPGTINRSENRLRFVGDRLVYSDCGDSEAQRCLVVLMAPASITGPSVTHRFELGLSALLQGWGLGSVDAEVVWVSEQRLWLAITASARLLTEGQIWTRRGWLVEIDLAAVGAQAVLQLAPEQALELPGGIIEGAVLEDRFVLTTDEGIVVATPACL